jgi:dihydrofolate reductase
MNLSAERKNSVFIATSLDGYIADKNGGIEWLHAIPNPEKIDMGYSAFMNRIDALVMGRNSFETVRNFGIPWPYEKPVFVLSNSLTSIPDELKKKVFLVNGSLSEISNNLHKKGLHKLYIDGGKTIQNFLKEDLIDEMVITTIPTLLGSGIPLFGAHQEVLEFECVESVRFLDKVVQSTFLRVRIAEDGKE